MLFESVRNEVLSSYSKLVSKYFQTGEPIPLSLNRLEREIRNTYDISSLFLVLHKQNYTWAWFSPALEKTLDLSYADTYRLARACADHSGFVRSSDCLNCNRDDDDY